MSRGYAYIAMKSVHPRLYLEIKIYNGIKESVREE